MIFADYILKHPFIKATCNKIGKYSSKNRQNPCKHYRNLAIFMCSYLSLLADILNALPFSKRMNRCNGAHRFKICLLIDFGNLFTNW